MLIKLYLSLVVVFFFSCRLHHHLHTVRNAWKPGRMHDDGHTKIGSSKMGSIWSCACIDATCFMPTVDDMADYKTLAQRITSYGCSQFDGPYLGSVDIVKSSAIPKQSVSHVDRRQHHRRNAFIMKSQSNSKTDCIPWGIYAMYNKNRDRDLVSRLLRLTVCACRARQDHACRDIHSVNTSPRPTRLCALLVQIVENRLRRHPKGTGVHQSLLQKKANEVAAARWREPQNRPRRARKPCRDRPFPRETIHFTSSSS